MKTLYSADAFFERIVSILKEKKLMPASLDYASPTLSKWDIKMTNGTR